MPTFTHTILPTVLNTGILAPDWRWILEPHDNFVVILFLFVIFMAMGFIYFERRVISRFQMYWAQPGGAFRVVPARSRRD